MAAAWAPMGHALAHPDLLATHGTTAPKSWQNEENNLFM
jgi:hypothetical protein